MTNNPKKVAAVEANGVTVVERVPLISGLNPHNEGYMQTKTDKMGHLLPDESA
jgi:GTP cyclohydrolase II